nr:hypothetical protein 1 [bacterium]
MNELGIEVSPPAGEQVAAEQETTQSPATPAVQGMYEPISQQIHSSVVPENINPFMTDAQRMKHENEVVTDDSIRNDPMFMDAARIIMRRDNPDNFDTMTDEEVVTGLMTKVNRLNYNIPAAIAAGVEYDDATVEEKAALSYALEQYDKKEISWAGAMGAVWGIATDPSSWFSVASLGLSTPAKVGGQVTARELLKQSLLRTPNLIGIEGAIYAGAADASLQNLEMTVDESQEFDPTRMALSIGVGAGLGKGIGEAGEAIGRGVSKLYKEGEQEAMKAAGGGELPGTGEGTQEFFSATVKGNDPRYKPSGRYKYDKTFKDPVAKSVKQNMEFHKGEFDKHIAASIPTFRETQVDKAAAIIKSYPEGATMIDHR